MASGSVIRISITAAAANAVAGLGAAGKAADKLTVQVTETDRAVKKLDGQRAAVHFDAKGFTQGIAQIVLARLALDNLTKGFPDLSFGLDAMAAKMTIATGAALSLTGAVLPLAGAAVALGAAAGAAGAGLALFGAAALPTIKSVTGAVQQYNTAADAFAKAKATGNVAAQATQAKNMAAALSVLTPQQRQAAKAILGMQSAWEKLSKTAAPVVLDIINKAAGVLAKIIPLLTPAISAMGKALDQVAGQGLSGLLGNIKPLVTLIVQQGVPAFKSLAAIGGGLALTVFHLVTAFAPLGNQILKAIVPLTSALSRFDFTPIFAFAKSLMPTVGALLQNIGGLVLNLIKAAAPLAGPVLSALSGIAEALKKAFASADIKAFVSNIAGIVAAVAPIVAVVIPAIAQVAHLLSGQLLALAPKLVPLIGRIADAFVNVLAGLSPLIPALLDFIGVFVSILPDLYPVITTLRAALVPVIGQLGNAVKILAPALLPVAKVLGSLLDAIAPLLPVVAQLAAILLDSLASAIQTLVPVIEPALKFLGPVLISVMKALVPVLQPVATLFATMVTAMAPLSQVLDEALLQALNGIIPVFVQLVPVLGQVAIQLFPAVVQVIKALLPLLPVLIQAWQEMFPPLIQIVDVLTPIVVFILKAAAAITTFLMPALKFLVPLLIAVMNPLGSIVSGFDHLFGIKVKTLTLPTSGIRSLAAPTPPVTHGLGLSQPTPRFTTTNAVLKGSSGSTTVNNYFTVKVPLASDRAAVGREIRAALADANRKDGLG